MLFLRKLIFYLFVVIYLISCPLLILYSLGYHYKPESKKSMVETGLIYLSTNPPGALVYIDNQRLTRKTPAILRDFLPGQYQVKLVLKDFRT